MNIEKVIASLKDCSAEELDQINMALQDTRLNQYRKYYSRISTYIGDALQQVGEANFGVVIRDSYENEVILYPTELKKESFAIEVYHKKDENKWRDELNLEEADEG